MESSAMNTRPVYSSLPLQVMLYFGGLYDIFYFVVEFILLCYKGTELPYTRSDYAVEMVLLWLYILVEGGRLWVGVKGNLTEAPMVLVVFIVLSIPITLLYVYYLIEQTYVLKLEVFLNIIAIVFCALQILLSIFAAITFINAKRQ